MKLEKLSWEEVIKIQLSYKIIKKDYVSLLKEDPSLIDTKIDFDGMDFRCKLNGKGSKEAYQQDRGNSSDEISQMDLLEFKEQRELIIKEAMVEAEKIKEKARAYGYDEGFNKGLEDGLKQGIDQGTVRGLKNGYIEGIDNAEEEANRIKDNAINMLEEAQEELDKYIDKNKNNIIDLAVQMAENIVHSTIDASSENILKIIRPIIQRFRKVESVIITCNPDNYDFLKKNLYEMERRYEDMKFIILEDESLEKNGCIIENDNQIVDLQIGKQLENIVEKINDME